MTFHPVDTYLCWEGVEALAATLSPAERSALLRAGRCAELLDEVEPGWHERLEPVLSLLQMGDPHRCVMGLLLGGYRAGLAELGVDEDEAPALGLEHDAGVDPYAIAADYAALREAWTTLVLSRCGRTA